ncbi:MAG: ABC transporter substrate-binding protein [Gammaproteobacteria bacterium]|nr:MAG: ABC transporter substrate-binding protein [Gammaproteobacteria bacterium]
MVSNAQAVTSESAPVRWLEEVMHSLHDEFQSKQAQFGDPVKLRKFFEERVFKYWALDKMARAVVGSAWRDMTPSQQAHWQRIWQQTILRYFMIAMKYYDGTLPTLEKSPECVSAQRCWVRSHIEISGHKTVDLDFFLVKRRDQQWKIADIRVAGISLVLHKRGENLAVIRTKGIDSLLAISEKKNQKALGDVSG